MDLNINFNFMKVIKVGDYNAWVGENAQDNWNILDDAKGSYWFFHLASFPSCYVIYACVNKLTPENIVDLSSLCKNNTKYRNLPNVKVEYTQCENVRKGHIIGECFYVSRKKVKVQKI